MGKKVFVFAFYVFVKVRISGFKSSETSSRNPEENTYNFGLKDRGEVSLKGA